MSNSYALRVALGALAGLAVGSAGVLVLPAVLVPGEQALGTAVAPLLVSGEDASGGPVGAPAIPEPAAAPEPSPDTAVPPGPGFDVVRVEPDGQALVAGRGEPGGTVQVLAGEAVVAEAPVDQEGRFAALFDLPPSPDARILSLSQGGIGSEATVLLGPTAAEPARTMPAVPEPSAADAPQALPGSDLAVADPGPALRETALPETGPALAEAARGEPEALPPRESVTVGAAPDPGAAVDPLALAARRDAAAPSQPANQGELALAAGAPTSGAAEPGTTGISAQPAADAPDRQVPDPGPALEPLVLGEGLVAAGPVEQGAAPEPTVAGPAAALGVAEPPEPRVRGDQALGELAAAPAAEPSASDLPPPLAGLESAGATAAPGPEGDTGGPAAAAALDAPPASLRDPSPQPVPAPVVSEGPSAPPPPEEPGGRAAVLLSDADGVRVVQPALAPGAGPEVLETVALDAIAYDGAGEVTLSGRATPGDTVRLYLDNWPLAVATAGSDGTWEASLSRAEPGVYTLRLDQLDAAGEVVSRIETPFERERREAIAAAVADAEAAGQGAAVRIVQPGNTLWAIARDRYGEPLMYVRVFEANRDRIRNPDLIYPGQVFVLPEIAAQ